MNYIENIFECLAAPLLITVIWTKGKTRRMMMFLIIGMLTCLLSSYVSTFIAASWGVDNLVVSLEFSPFVEEVMKLIPVLFYLLVFEPEAHDAADGAFMVAVGFATFENVCFLVGNGANNILNLLIRGFGTATAHVVCALFIAMGIYRLWDEEWLRAAGSLALLAVAITYHGIFNLLVSQTGVVALIGYLIPLFTIVYASLYARHLFFKKI